MSKVIFWVIVIITVLTYEFIRRRRAQNSAHKMNVLFGGSFTPRLERALTDEEMQMLKSKEPVDLYYSDLISPVKKLIGPISFPFDIKPGLSDYENKQKIHEGFDVGGESFSIYGVPDDIRNPQSLLTILHTFDHNDLVEVEYTPHTRTVLKLYKYNGEKE